MINPIVRMWSYVIYCYRLTQGSGPQSDWVQLEFLSVLLVLKLIFVHVLNDLYLFVDVNSEGDQQNQPEDTPILPQTINGDR